MCSGKLFGLFSLFPNPLKHQFFAFSLLPLYNYGPITLP